MLRGETEWSELIELGWNEFAASDGTAIAEQILAAVGRRGRSASRYGDVAVAKAIATAFF